MITLVHSSTNSKVSIISMLMQTAGLAAVLTAMRLGKADAVGYIHIFVYTCSRITVSYSKMRAIAPSLDDEYAVALRSWWPKLALFCTLLARKTFRCCRKRTTDNTAVVPASVVTAAVNGTTNNGFGSGDLLLANVPRGDPQLAELTRLVSLIRTGATIDKRSEARMAEQEQEEDKEDDDDDDGDGDEEEAIGNDEALVVGDDACGVDREARRERGSDGGIVMVDCRRDVRRSCSSHTTHTTAMTTGSRRSSSSGSSKLPSINENAPADLSMDLG